MLKIVLSISLFFILFCSGQLDSRTKVEDLGKIKLNENTWLVKINVINEKTGVYDKVYFLVNDSNFVIAGATTFQGKNESVSLIPVKIK